MDGKRNKTRSRSFKIGVATLVSLFCLYFGANFLKGINIFDASKGYYISFETVEGLDRSSVVLLKGHIIGKVREVDFDYSSLQGAVVEVAMDAHLKLPRGTMAKIYTNPFGGAQIVLELPSGAGGEQGYFSPGDTIRSIPSFDMIAQISNEVLPNLLQVTARVDSLLRDVQLLVNNPEIPEALTRINQSAHSIQSTSAQLSHIMHHQVPGIISNVDSSAMAIHQITAKVNSTEVEQALSEFVSVVNDLKKVSTQINSSNNTMGLLLNDRELYQNLLEASSSADSLLKDIKANPKRYIKLSLF